MRRTKILATLGPATDNPRVIEGLIKVGVDVIRLNFSHGNHDDHRRRARLVRESAKALGRSIGILGDLQGPKIRTERFVEGKVQLRKGAGFVLDAALPDHAGTAASVGITYKQLADDVHPGNTLVLDDGRIELEVKKIQGGQIHTRVRTGGILSNNKGINLRGGGLSTDAITDKDRADIELAGELEVDFLAVSFPRSAKDLEVARSLIHTHSCDAAIIAKIERAEALSAIDEIIEASDGIMIARGDLGVEIGDAELPAVQKDLIKRARANNRAVITATQMMESMIHNPTPTRAEVFDVANAVIDGTDAVMLSAESATGAHPVKAVRAMSEICEKAEQHPGSQKSHHRLDSNFSAVDESIAMATMYTANHLHVRAIAAFTGTGRTVTWMSRISSGIPIYALANNARTRRRVTLFRGVYPVAFDTEKKTSAEVNKTVINMLLKHQELDLKDFVIITKQDLETDTCTNIMKILCVDDWIDISPSLGSE